MEGNGERLNVRVIEQECMPGVTGFSPQEAAGSGRVSSRWGVAHLWVGPCHVCGMDAHSRCREVSKPSGLEGTNCCPAMPSSSCL